MPGDAVAKGWTGDAGDARLVSGLCDVLVGQLGAAVSPPLSRAPQYAQLPRLCRCDVQYRSMYISGSALYIIRRVTPDGSQRGGAVAILPGVGC